MLTKPSRDRLAADAPRVFDIGEVGDLVRSPAALHDWLTHHLPELVGPVVSSISPGSGPRGTVLAIEGANFSTDRLANDVTVGGTSAFVLQAEASRLLVLVGPDTDSGPVEVTIGGRTASSAVPFTVTGYAAPGDDTTDGPPVVTTGVADAPGAGDVNPIGQIRVLVVLLQTSDTVPATPATVRTQVSNAWDRVHTYYDQASYTRTDVVVDQTNFGALDGTLADFLDTSPSVQNFRKNQLPRIAAIGANAAVAQGFNLDDYAMACFVTFTNGQFVRAWGGGSQTTFAYDNGKPSGDPNRISINLTANHAINTLFINESSDWGRFAHEFGHNVVSAPTESGDGTATLGEDVYGSDLVDPSAATARQFELMGNHDSHPLFTGYHLEKLGYYQPANIKTLTWDRNPHAESVDIVAHGLTEDTDPNRVHLVKVKVSDALTYYVEVRQRPGGTPQVFDDNIPFGASANQGGVIVTRVIAGEMHNNQQTRFISLMHAERVLLAGESADDPARALRIIVENDAVQARPLVCRVRIEWAQTIADDPNGSFDLRIEPWDTHYQSPDIWVDRDPFGSFDNALDSEGRPIGNGDRPRVGKINQVAARIHVSGAMGASNVKVTHYAVTPPGVGDNGNWAPIAVNTVASIGANGFADVMCNWVPVVGKHTCLQAHVSAQLGEISGHNNAAQENVADFISAGASPCQPVIVRTAIRNPLDERRAVLLSLDGVPRGWMAQLPNAWVWLDGRAEKEVDVAIWPVADSSAYRIGSAAAKGEKGERRLPGMAPVRVKGAVGREYDVSVMPSGEPAASRFYPIGGVFYRVHVRRRSSIAIEVGRSDKDEFARTLYAWVNPAVGDQRVLVDVTAPTGDDVGTLAALTAPDGRACDPVRPARRLQAVRAGRIPGSRVDLRRGRARRRHLERDRDPALGASLRALFGRNPAARLVPRAAAGLSAVATRSAARSGLPLEPGDHRGEAGEGDEREHRASRRRRCRGLRRRRRVGQRPSAGPDLDRDAETGVLALDRVVAGAQDLDGPATPRRVPRNLGRDRVGAGLAGLDVPDVLPIAVARRDDHIDGRAGREPARPHGDPLTPPDRAIAHRGAHLRRLVAGLDLEQREADVAELAVEAAADRALVDDERLLIPLAGSLAAPRAVVVEDVVGAVGFSVALERVDAPRAARVADRQRRVDPLVVEDDEAASKLGYLRLPDALWQGEPGRQRRRGQRDALHRRRGRHRRRQQQDDGDGQTPEGAPCRPRL
ncbi:MAG: IPT/TIG domain-containing protein [Chloroflexota bacterium]